MTHDNDPQLSDRVATLEAQVAQLVQTLAAVSVVTRSHTHGNAVGDPGPPVIFDPEA